MKRVFILLLVVLSCRISYAQKLELGIHGGFGANTAPQTGQDSVLPANSSSVINYAVSLKALTNVSNFQFGIGLDMQKLSRSLPGTKYIYANPATTISLIANWKVTYSFYAGADIGLMFASSANYSTFSNNTKVPDVVYMEPGTGYAAGLHFGYKVYINSRLNLAAELGGKYASYKYDYAHTDNLGHKTIGQDTYTVIYPSVVVGIRLKLFTDPFNQWLPYKRVN